MHHFLESWLPRCTIKTPAYRHNRRTKLSSNRTRKSSKKSRTGHASTPKVANPSIATETAQSSARFVSIIALSTLPCVPGPRSHGPPRCGARWACRPHVPIAFRCFKTASPQRPAKTRHLGHSRNLWRVRALAVSNSGHAGQIPPELYPAPASEPSPAPGPLPSWADVAHAFSLAVALPHEPWAACRAEP